MTASTIPCKITHAHPRPAKPRACKKEKKIKFLLRRPCSQPPTAFSAARRHVPRLLRQPAASSLRLAKRPPGLIHECTDSLRLPRFRNASHIDVRARSLFLAQRHAIQQFQLACTIPCACHAKRCPVTHQVTPFPTPATRNAIPRSSAARAATIPHACRAKRPYTRTRRPARDTLNCSAQ